MLSGIQRLPDTKIRRFYRDKTTRSPKKVAQENESQLPLKRSKPLATMKNKLRITYVGGPTALLEFGGLHWLTDPTFDPGGTEYKSGPATLRKLHSPAVSPEKLGDFDYVLLSHDHHSDNLDHAGSELLVKAKSVLTTPEGSHRLRNNSLGLKEWESVEFSAGNGKTVRVTAAPGRHGPEGLDRGAVTGFVLSSNQAPEAAVYISGDTVWYPGVAEVAKRFPIRVVLLHLGAARVPEVGPYHLTMTAAEGVETARYFSDATIVPIHFEDWGHFSEGREVVNGAFSEAGFEARLRWPERGRSIQISLDPVSSAICKGELG